MKKVLPILISVIVLVANIISVQAAENLLSDVNIKNNANSYTIELTATEPAKMTKTIISSNRILLNLDNIKLLNNIPTRYDKNTTIDNVIIEPQGSNSISIMLQGDNIAFSDVTFKEPTSIKHIENNIIDSVTSFGMNIISFSGNKTIPCVFLIILLCILISEIKFIYTKYKELNSEKSLLEKDIERTVEFKDYMTGYGHQGIEKPYTTPIYTNPSNTSLIRANYLKRLQNLQTPETITLNSILSNDNQETKIINKIVNNKPVFGSLSNILTETVSETKSVTSPVSKPQLKSHLQHLETLSKLYQQTAENKDSIKKRLNSLY